MSDDARVDWTSSRTGPCTESCKHPRQVDPAPGGHGFYYGSDEEACGITGFLEGEDTRATARAFVQMGVRIEAPGASARIVHGVGLHGLARARGADDQGNAGTGMRLLAGLLAGQEFDPTPVGDESLSRRPMRRVIGAAGQMGANKGATGAGLPPLHIAGRQRLRKID